MVGDEELTGRRRHRGAAFKRLVLQVEVRGSSYDQSGRGSYGPEYTRWRDAVVEDLDTQDPVAPR